MHFHVTKKARELLGLLPADLASVGANDPPPLTSWYVNTFTLRRKKCVHITEASTFYTCMLTDVRKSGMRYLGGLARDVLVESMTNDGFAFPGLRDFIGQGIDTYAKTSSRQVLGVMNEQAAMFVSFVDDHGGLDSVDTAKANTWLNRMIVMPLKDLYTPKGAMAAALKAMRGEDRSP